MTWPLAGAVALLGIWNIIRTEVLPEVWYVPANLLAAGALVLAARALALTVDELGLSPSTLHAGIRLGLWGTVIVAAVIGTALAVPYTRALFEDDRYGDASGADIAYQVLVRIPLGTVVFEELAFRGFLLALFARRSGWRRAMLASSVLFGLWHVLPTLSALRTNDLAVGAAVRSAAVAGGVLLTGVAGIVFCLLRRRSASLVAPAITHVATNSLGAVAAFLALRDT